MSQRALFAGICSSTCQDGEKTIVEANRDWDIQLPIAVLTRIV